MSISQLINNYVGILRNKKRIITSNDEISSIKKEGFRFKRYNR